METPTTDSFGSYKRAIARIGVLQRAGLHISHRLHHRRHNSASLASNPFFLFDVVQSQTASLNRVLCVTVAHVLTLTNILDKVPRDSDVSLTNKASTLPVFLVLLPDQDKALHKLPHPRPRAARTFRDSANSTPLFLLNQYPYKYALEFGSTRHSVLCHSVQSSCESVSTGLGIFH